MSFWSSLVNHFLVAFGVVFGAGCFSGIAAVINDRPPLKAMNDMSYFVKVWAIAIALGGSFDSLEMFEKGILHGQIRHMIREVACIIAAMIGANIGAYVIKLIAFAGNRMP
ncbi:MAG: sporulation protein [Clostridiaceae bacterium]|nr:sporulation protein [Clostridiaceae bacterium]